MHPDSGHMHLKRAQRLGRDPQPDIEERDFLGGLGSAIGGIINGIGNIINGGHHSSGGGGSQHQSSPPKNNGGGSKGSPAKPAAAPAKPTKPAQAEHKPAAPATTKKVTNNQAAAANTRAVVQSSAAPQTKVASSSEKSAQSSSLEKAPETHLSSARSASASVASSSTATAISSTYEQTSSIDASSTLMPGTWAPGDSPGGVNAASPSGGLSKGGLAAIITILLLLLLGALFFLWRRYQKKQRENRSAASAWGESHYPKFDEKNKQTDLFSVAEASTMVQRPSKAAGDDQSYVTAADLGHQRYSNPSFPVGLVAHTGHSPGGSPISPSFAAENRQMAAFSDFGRSPPTSPLSAGPLTPLTGMPYDMAVLPHTPTSSGSESFETQSGSGLAPSSSLSAMEALVSRTFIPNRKDELDVATGERIRVLNEYDDGWALCQNSRGDEGMVPIECIQKLSSGPSGLQPSWRHSQRISSLSGHDEL